MTDEVKPPLDDISRTHLRNENVNVEFDPDSEGYQDHKKHPRRGMVYFTNVYDMPRLATEGRLPTVQEMRDHFSRCLGTIADRWDAITHVALTQECFHHNSATLRLFGPGGEMEEYGLGRGWDIRITGGIPLAQAKEDFGSPAGPESNKGSDD